ncbi:MAG: UDP-glucose 4-epimerase GalE [Candidatus Ancillula trichonymphae]|jgi:UDP-glucose 4-epimerase|nr:UDP-glucose 4-epimerase GalE [Candidatus Ancillula trichonymphae]
MVNVLITGGAGYIGSHTAVLLSQEGYDIYIIDNFINSEPSALRAVEKITSKCVQFFEVDLTNSEELDAVFSKNSFDVVIHFAGLKSVGESVGDPLKYYNNNISSTLNLLNSMRKYNITKLVFSSSATVYGKCETVPLAEDFPIGQTTNPYATSKFVQELILKDVALSNNLNIMALRYFNPVGAHTSGLLGENPKGIPNNLCPYILQVLSGKLDRLNVFGDDYETADGSAIRDYIHVVDLAVGHLKAIEKLLCAESSASYDAINLGRGVGVSVLEMIKSFESATGRKVPYKIAGRRQGDLPVSYAATDKASAELGFQAERSIEQACLGSWRYQEHLNKTGASKEQSVREK